jgi:hypothetical protein
MFEIKVVCSACNEETAVVVEKLDDVEHEVCACGYSFLVLSVAEFEPIYPGKAQVIELRRRGGDDLSRAA